MRRLYMKLSTKLMLPVLAVSLISSSAFSMQPKVKRSWQEEFVRSDASYIKFGTIIAGITTGLFRASQAASSFHVEKIVENTLYLRPCPPSEIISAGLGGIIEGSVAAFLLLGLANFTIGESLAND